MDEEEVHIAVGKNSRKEKANILWAAANFPRATIVLVHVHWPSKWMPFMGGRVLYKFADEKEKEMHRGREMKVMVNMLSQYKKLCGKRKVSAHYLTHDDTVAGVMNLIKKLKIRRIVIGSRSMSRQVVLRQCCQVWVVLNGKHISTSNDHLEHSENIGYGRSSGILASIHELGEESDGYVTPPSDLVDEIMDEESNETNDSDQLVTEDETLTEQGTEESVTSEEMENLFEEGADQSVEIQSFRNITEKAEKIMEEIERLQKKLKQLQGEEPNHGERSLSPRQMAASLQRKSLSEPRYPELQIPENIGRIQPLKIPDAVAALAQAAAKANGESEKYLPGWPLFSPPKVQLDKCTKCSREFCSAINFRRHTRVHRRTLKIDRDFPKNRDLLAAFWSKLTVEDASTILSLTGVVIEGVTGSSVLTALSSWMCKPGYASLPMAYARAGSELLDLIQTKASLHLPVSSDELFSLLDEASEKTFLCTDTAACIQKFLFDGEADKTATELKNVVSCVSYMLEQKLVEAWCADKTAKALRCQKLLEEEEEAAQKRQAELMERKRMKKLRQKEQRLKNLKDEDVTVQSPEIMDDATCSTAIQSVKSISDPDRSEQEEQEESQYLQFPAPITSESDNGFNVDLSVEDNSCDLGPEMDKGVVLKQQVSRRQLGTTETLDENSFVPGPLGTTERLDENSIVPGPVVTSKHPAFVRPSNYKVPNVCSALSRNKTCALKLQSEIEEQCQKHELDVDEHGMGPSKTCRVLIGSISVAIEDGSEHLQDFHSKNDTVPPSSNTVKYASVKMMQLVTHEGNRNEGIPHSDSDSTPAAENHSHSSVTTDEISYSTYCSADLVVDEHLQRTMFSSKEAMAFLSQRWKKAIAADHVKLVLCSEK